MNSASLESSFISTQRISFLRHVEYRRKLPRELWRCSRKSFEDRQVLDLHVYNPSFHVSTFHRGARVGRTWTRMQHWHARLRSSLREQILAIESDFALGDAASRYDYPDRIFRNVLELEGWQGQACDSEERRRLQEPPKVLHMDWVNLKL